MVHKRLGVVVCLVVMLLAVSLRPAQAAEPPIDLQADINRDGIPDDLYRQVASLPQASDPTAAVASLVNRLPYSAHTRALQQQAANLYYQLLMLELMSNLHLDGGQVQKLAVRLADLQHEMMADPQYAATQRALTALLAPEQSGLRQPSTAPPASGQAGVDWKNLRRGDVLLSRSGKTPWTAGIYAMWYDHAGIYDGNGWVYEANPDGVRRQPLKNWQRSGQYVALARANSVAPEKIQAALDQAERAFGAGGQTPYNYVYPDKWSTDSLYCSQLVWQIYERAGVNLDGDSWSYALWLAAHWGMWSVTALAQPAAAPDEIASNTHLTVYSQGWTEGKG